MNNKKLKILFMPLSSFVSHTTRCLSVAEVFQENGHIVDFVACIKYQEFIENAGFRVHPVSDIDYEKIVAFGAPDDYHQRYNPDLANMKYGLVQMAKDDARILDEVNPDLVVFDGRATVIFPALKKKIPCVEIRNHVGYIHGEERAYLKEQGVTRDFQIALKDENDFVSEFYRAVQNYAVDLEYYKSIKYYPIPVLIPGIPEFEITDGVNFYDTRPNIFIGPLYWKGWKSERLPDLKYLKRKVILVTVGSTFPFINVMKNICSVFNNEDYFVIINAGDDFAAVAGDSNLDNFYFVEYINLQEYLEFTDLVIYHGGHGTSMYVLNAGVPSVVIPFNGDHTEITRHIDYLKVGKQLKKYPDDITAADIKGAVTEVLENSEYRTNAQKFKNLIRKWDNAPERAAEYILNYYNELQKF